jgi:hypothetical protein
LPGSANAGRGALWRHAPYPRAGDWLLVQRGIVPSLGPPPPAGVPLVAFRVCAAIGIGAAPGYANVIYDDGI